MEALLITLIIINTEINLFLFVVLILTKNRIMLYYRYKASC